MWFYFSIKLLCLLTKCWIANDTVSSRSCLGNNYRKLVQKELSFWVLGHLKELELKLCHVISENMALLNALVSLLLLTLLLTFHPILRICGCVNSIFDSRVELLDVVWNLLKSLHHPLVNKTC